MVQKVDTGRIYAMKVINKDSIVRNNAVKHTLAEKNVLKRLNHPFIVGLKFSFQTEDKLFMVLDYINGGELFYHLSEAGKNTLRVVLILCRTLYRRKSKVLYSRNSACFRISTCSRCSIQVFSM